MWPAELFSGIYDAPNFFDGMYVKDSVYIGDRVKFDLTTFLYVLGYVYTITQYRGSNNTSLDTPFCRLRS